MKRNRIGAALLAGALALMPQAAFAAGDDASAVAEETASGTRPAPVTNRYAEAAANNTADLETASARLGEVVRSVDLTPKESSKKKKFRGNLPQTDAEEAASYIESQKVFEIASLRHEATGPEYRLFRGDSVNILAVGYPGGIGMSGFTVGIDGYIQLPYVGSVKMEGLTLDEAKDVLMTSLNEYLKIPDMSLLITGYGPRKVYVMGEVKSPGIHNMNIDNMNAYAALASAGGWTRDGRSTKIQIMRVMDGVMYYRTLNMKAYTKKHDFTQNVIVQDGDIIYVPKTNGFFFSDVLPYFQAWAFYRSITN